MLFKDSDTFRKYAPFAATADFKTALSTNIDFVERTYLVPILGNELYKSLSDSYKSAANEVAFSNNDLYDLLTCCRLVIGPMFAYHYAPIADVQLSTSGIQRTETATNKTAYQYQASNFREENFRQGESAIELLIKYLEDNVTESFLDQWKESNEFKKYRGMFIKTAAEFSDYYPSHTPYRNYWAMRNKMYDIQEVTIRAFLGDTIYNALLTKAKTDTPNFTDKERRLIDLLCRAISYATVAASIPFLSVKMEANGLTVSAPTSITSNDNLSSRSGADNKSISHLISACDNSCKLWMNSATDYIKANKEDFPTWPGFVTVDPCSNHSLNTTFSL